MDATTEKLRDRLRKAAGDHRDETQVLVQVGDLLAALRALEEVSELEGDLQDMIAPKEHEDEISGIEEEHDAEVAVLKDEIAELRQTLADCRSGNAGLQRMLADAMLAA